MLNPKTNPPSYWQSGGITANANAATFKSAIYIYYTTYFNSDIDVTLRMLDANNIVTTNLTLAVRYNYTVTVKKLITGYSFNAVTV